MKEHNIEVCAFPPHCTHVLQPLDDVPYAVMKKKYQQELLTFNFDVAGAKMNKAQFFRVLILAVTEAFKADNIRKGYCQTGIYQLTLMLKSSKNSDLASLLISVSQEFNVGNGSMFVFQMFLLFCVSSRSKHSSGSTQSFYGKRVTFLNRLFIGFTDAAQGGAAGTGGTGDGDAGDDNDDQKEGTTEGTEEEEGAVGGDSLAGVPGNEVEVLNEDEEEYSSDDEEEEDDEDDEEDQYLAQFINKSGPVSSLQAGQFDQAGHKLLFNFSHFVQVLRKIDRPQRSASKRSYVEEEPDDDDDDDKSKKHKCLSSRSAAL